MKKPLKRGRKPTNRTAIMYGRVNPKNKKWFERLSGETKASVSAGLDLTLGYLRTNPEFIKFFQQTLGSN